MSDLLTFARDRRSDLARQIDELEEFVRMARHLAETAMPPVAMQPLSGAGAGSGTTGSPALRPSEARPAAEQAAEADVVETASDTDSIEESDTGEDQATRALLANAPWKGVMPKMRGASTGDPFAPTRFNLLRRGAPAAG